MIDRADVLKMAKLAMLELDEDEINRQQQELNRILDYIETLKEVDTDGIEPMIHPIDLAPLLREDEIQEVLMREEVFQNAPASVEYQFKVPKIIGDAS